MTSQFQPPQIAHSTIGNVASRPRSFRYSAVKLLLALGLLDLSAPFIEDLPNGDMVESALLTLVMIFSVLAIGSSRRTLLTAAVLFVPALAGKWASHFFPGVVTSVVYLVAAMVFFAFVVAHLIRFILRATHVDANVLCAGLSGYILLGLLWLPAYVMVAKIDPGSLSLPAGASMDGFNAFYFSFITLCTVGYGDVTPVSKGARMLAVTEAIAGLFYVAVLISRLVAIYTSPPPALAAASPAKATVGSAPEDFLTENQTSTEPKNL